MFLKQTELKVRNPAELAHELAYRAHCLRRLAVNQLAEEKEKGPLRNLYNAFKEALVHDQTEDEFADAFAQTIAYGLLTARWIGNDRLVADGERLTRQTALKYLPAASPFLNDFFKSVLSVKLEEQRGLLLWLVDDIADLLDRVDVAYVFGPGDKDSDTATDPIIHFYEPFLAAYDKELKNKRGVFFTPRPVVSYIVRSVHELLQKEFGLEDGLASTETWGDVAKRIDGLKIPDGVKASDPFVCILDPATGTGTFLFECIEVIERTMKDRWCRELETKDWRDPAVVAKWNEYVPKHLLPRLFGYELMMASYAIAHLKLNFKLGETGYRLGETNRLNVYLTNSLDPPSDAGQQEISGVFAALAHEAAAVSAVKQHKRFTVVIGNPPYSGISSNMSEDAQRIVDAYKIVDGSALNERKLWLQDDYVKFIRKAQTMIDGTNVGVFGYITNHGYLDNPTFRGMRQSLIGTFPCLHVLDLHGNANKNEKSPDGSIDESVFDIKQGVAICLATRGGQRDTIAHAELWGKREEKYMFLAKHDVNTTTFSLLEPDSPFYFFKPQNTDCRAEYGCGWSLPDIFHKNGVGIITARDALTIDMDIAQLWERVQKFSKLSPEQARSEYDLGTDVQSWKVTWAQEDVRKSGPNRKLLHKILYRPFDTRHIYYSGESSGFVCRPVYEVMRHMIGGENLGLLAKRQSKRDPFSYIWCAKGLVESCVFESAYANNSIFPLYVVDEADAKQGKIGETNCSRLNFDAKFLCALSRKLGLPRFGEHGLPKGVLVEDIFHYAYAVFHSPGYRKRYAEYLKIDFPRLPLTGNLPLFRTLVGLGDDLVALHLLESPALDHPVTEFIGGRNPKIEKVFWSKNSVWVDKSQTIGFKDVPENVWAFQIGGYQVCEKWLKDRGPKKGQPGRMLSDADISHYQKIVVAISETIRIMKEIDEVINKHGGWPGAFLPDKQFHEEHRILSHVER